MRLVIRILFAGIALATAWMLTRSPLRPVSDPVPVCANPDVMYVADPLESEPDPRASVDETEFGPDLADEESADFSDARAQIPLIQMSEAEQAEWNRRRRVRLLAPNIPRLRETFETTQGRERLLAAHELLRYSIAVILEDKANGQLSEQLRICNKIPRDRPTALLPSADGSLVAYVHQREYSFAQRDFPEFKACNVRAWRLQHGDSNVSIEVSDEMAAQIRARADQALAVARSDLAMVAPR